ncbi:RagB/SusD family nutrient uptake outer membrane protein [Proteiniphilum sp. X52]|uniref:RagB/SusD family nutrient uptake outer membrane protein n=1 Tax=Proteiniphilum sp. X52 TaxID=2382159 RepID=UPI000F0A0639|nr:RagB/SusD family nutrient uptake outer membrane protein [Proteiniphilum sp. X52]RNC66407.1 RagB/SusD family nutrient uptake outer membrane protein [Proteiniphilum sp. X52]
MNKLTYIICMIIAVMMIPSCTLDEASYTEIEKKNYLNTASEAETVLLGVYRKMVEEGMYRFHLSMLFTIPTDIAKVQGNSPDGLRLVPSNSYTSTQIEVQQTWSSLYSAIYDANDFIEQLSRKSANYSEREQQLAAIYMAEARTLRALYYFELVRWFGNVALMTNTGQSHQNPATFVQANPVDVYKFIETDLLYAIDNLPYATDDNFRSDNSFRVSKGAVMGLLTKVYATWAGHPVLDQSKWEDAAKIAGTLINSGKHTLINDYEQLWKNTCNGIWDPSESLLEVSFYSPSITGTAAFDPSGRIGKWNGVTATNIRGVRNAGNWKVIPTFLRDWNNRSNDKRWQISFADYRYGVSPGTGQEGVKIPISNNATIQEALAQDASDNIKRPFMDNLSPAKWDTEKYVDEANYLVDANLSNINWYILRYSDVLLLYAEAINEFNKGPNSDAYEAVNSVRRRGFGLPMNTGSSMADLPANLTYEEFQAAVRAERAYELAFEGHRRQDLTRWGIYYESIMKTAQDIADWYSDGPQYYIPANHTKKNKHELLPIPQRDLDLMTNFKQNPGW